MRGGGLFFTNLWVTLMVWESGGGTRVSCTSGGGSLLEKGVKHPERTLCPTLQPQFSVRRTKRILACALHPVESAKQVIYIWNWEVGQYGAEQTWLQWDNIWCSCSSILDATDSNIPRTKNECAETLASHIKTHRQRSTEELDQREHVIRTHTAECWQ